MKVWAIQHVTTGNYLPAAKTNRGFSYDEPSTKTKPRLHYSYKSAKMALQSWLKGHSVAEYSMKSESWELPQKFSVFEGIHHKEVAYRKTLVMRIVEFELVDQAPLERPDAKETH